MPDVSKGIKVKIKEVRSDIWILEHLDIPKNNLIEPIQASGAYDISSFKVKENCWAFVTATVYTPSYGDGADGISFPGGSSSYNYWQPLGKGSRWYIGARGITYSNTIYPIVNLPPLASLKRRLLMFKCKTVRQTNTDVRKIVEPPPVEPAGAGRHNCPSIFSNRLHGRI